MINVPKPTAQVDGQGLAAYLPAAGQFMNEGANGSGWGGPFAASGSDKLKGLVPMFVPMVVSSLSRMETMSMALESRAFGNTKHPTEMTEIRVRPGDLALLAAGIILMIVAIVIRVRFGSLNWASQVDCWSRVLLPQL